MGNIMGDRAFTQQGPGGPAFYPPQRETDHNPAEAGTTYPGNVNVRTIDRPGFHMEIHTSSSPGGGWTIRTGNMDGGNPAFHNNPAFQGGDLFTALGPLFTNMLGPMQRSGDYAFSQEGFDRIVSNLMEQNATGSAPGPATEQAIASLPTREITTKDLSDGKAECSICIE